MEDVSEDRGHPTEASHEPMDMASTPQPSSITSPSPSFAIPGLGLLSQALAVESNPSVPVSEDASKQSVMDVRDEPQEVGQAQEELVNVEDTEEMQLSDPTKIEHQPEIRNENLEHHTPATIAVPPVGDAEQGMPVDMDVVKSEQEIDEIKEDDGIVVKEENGDVIKEEGSQEDGHVPDAEQNEAQKKASEQTVDQKIDPEFLDAAQANKGNEEAEWQYDSSDAETSSSDTSSDTSSDDDDDDGEDYELLDPETVAKMLMAEEGCEDEDGPRTKTTGNFQLRTKNEKPEEVVPRPDVVVTPEMKITLLGRVGSIVDNLLLIKANTTGEYQVLEQASVLCLSDRKVLGAVAETFGRVQEPMYSVAFTNAQEVADTGVTLNAEVYYVDSHSTFVFTQPLKNLKGTDASNLHDEEVGEDEMEFSDDEAEAAYKKAKKEAKRGGRKTDYAPSGPAPGHVKEYSHPQSLDYDDGPSNETYIPLSRPSNLQDMMTSEPPPLEQRHPHATSDRGRGRGRGDRGRGRGRGDRGRGDRGRGRGGGDSNSNRQGPAHSFPDRHNSDFQAQPQPQSNGRTTNQWSNPTQPAWPPAYNMHQFQQQPYGQASSQTDHAALPQMLWAMQQQQQQQQRGGNGYQTPQQSFPPPPPPPAGAFVNPAFFQGQQQQQQGGQGQWGALPPNVQQQLEYLRTMQNQR